MKLLLLFIFLIHFSYLKSQIEIDTNNIFQQIIKGENIIYKDIYSLPDSICKFISYDMILFKDKKRIKRIRKHTFDANYKNIFLIASFDYFFIVNYRHYGFGAHDHLLILDYTGKEILNLISGYSVKESLDVLKLQLVKTKMEIPYCK
jgi:hypothetical protein